MRGDKFSLKRGLISSGGGGAGWTVFFSICRARGGGGNLGGPVFHRPAPGGDPKGRHEFGGWAVNLAQYPPTRGGGGFVGEGERKEHFVLYSPAIPNYFFFSKGGRKWGAGINFCKKIFGNNQKAKTVIIRIFNKSYSGKKKSHLYPAFRDLPPIDHKNLYGGRQTWLRGTGGGGARCWAMGGGGGGGGGGGRGGGGGGPRIGGGRFFPGGGFPGAHGANRVLGFKKKATFLLFSGPVERPPGIFQAISKKGPRGRAGGLSQTKKPPEFS